jgi:hypothetical protein
LDLLVGVGQNIFSGKNLGDKTFSGKIFWRENVLAGKYFGGKMFWRENDLAVKNFAGFIWRENDSDRTLK